jgi:hypothetical protein
MPVFLLELFLEMSFHEIFTFNQKYWKVKTDESLRKEMTGLVVGQLPSMSKLLGSLPSTTKKPN